MESISTQQQQVSLLVRFRGKKVVIDNLGSFQEFKETLTPKPPLSTSVITTLSSVIKERLQQQQMISIFDEQILSEFDIQYFAHDFMEYVDFVAGDPSSFLLRLQKDDLRARILIIERPATSSTPSPST